MKKWTDFQDKFLRSNYATVSVKDIALKLGRTVNSINNRAFGLGLKKPDEFWSNCGRALQAHPNCRRFPAGFEPWNKGKKYNAGGRSIETQFKKGRYVPHKEFYIHKSKGIPYKWVWDGPTKRKLMHRHVWEQAHGPIPEGCNISFKDGNTLNCELSNLYMISRQKQVIENSIKRFPEELQKTILTLKKLQKLTHGKENPRPQRNTV